MGIHAASPIPKPSSAPSIPIRSFVLNSVTKVHHYEQQIASGTHFSPHEEREPLAQCTLFGGGQAHQRALLPQREGVRVPRGQHSKGSAFSRPPFLLMISVNNTPKAIRCPSRGLLRKPCPLTLRQATQTHSPQRRTWKFLNLQASKSSASLSREGKPFYFKYWK